MISFNFKFADSDIKSIKYIKYEFSYDATVPLNDLVDTI